MNTQTEVSNIPGQLHPEATGALIGFFDDRENELIRDYADNESAVVAKWKRVGDLGNLAADVFGHLGTAASEPLLERVDGPEGAKGLWHLDALGAVDDPRAIEQVLELIDERFHYGPAHSHHWIRGIRVLGRVGTRKGVKLLNKALTLPDRGTPVDHIHRAAQAALDRLADGKEG